MAIDKIFNDGNVDGIADNIFNAVNNSVSEVKQMQQRKAAENAQMVVQSLKKIDTDIREKYDNVTTTLEKRIITIKDGRDGIDGKDGRDGKNGKDGRDGKDGKTGPQGPKGQDGIDGLDGVSVANANIDFDGSLIIALSNGQEINVGEVVSPDLADKIQVISTMSTNGAVAIKDEGTVVSSGVKSLNFVGTNITATTSGDDVTVTVTGGSGSGTVTSVAATVPTFLSVTGSPITTSGTLAISLSGTALPVANGGTGITSFGTGVATFLGTPSSANLAAAVTDETGSGALVFATSPTLVTPILGTPTSGTLTNATGLPISTGVSGLGTGVATALAVNVGTAGAPLVNGGVLGTPSSGTATNLTGLPLTTGVTGTLPTANGGTNLTSFTSGGVVYASSTSALSTGSALTFDGTSLSVSGGRINTSTADVGGTIGGTAQLVTVNTNGSVGDFSGIRFNYFNSGDGGGKFAYIGSVLTSDASSGIADIVFGVKSSIATTTITEQMRLTSTGLGIGTSSPLSKFDVAVEATLTRRLLVNFDDSVITVKGANNSSNPETLRITGDNIRFNTGTSGSGTERMRLDSSGNLVIGGTSAASKLDVVQAGNTSGGTIMMSGSKTNNAIKYGNLTGAHYASSTYPQGICAIGVLSTTDDNFIDIGGNVGEQIASNTIRFWTASNTTTSGGTERARIDSSGNLLVGTTGAAGSKFRVNSSGLAGAFYVTAASTTATEAIQIVKFDNNSTTAQVFQKFYINDGAAACGQINANGANTAAFGSTSDSRLKENIVDLPSQLDNIMSLRPVEFDYIESEGGGHQIGFIAQEVQAIYPDLVGERADGMFTLTDLNKNDARLIKAIQEQQALITQLTARITALEGA